MTGDLSYDALVFDHDGVIVEPTDWTLIEWAVERTFLEFGVEAPADDLVQQLLASDVDPLAEVERRHGIDPAEFWRRRERNAAAEQTAAVRRDDKTVYDDVSVLADLDVPLGIVSNNQHETVEFVLDYHGLAAVFDTVYGRYPSLSGARRAKPSPYYLEAAVDDLGATDPLYVGDSNADLHAAEAAGVDVAFLRRDHRADYDLDGEPTHEFESLSGLVEALDGPPNGA